MSFGCDKGLYTYGLYLLHFFTIYSSFFFSFSFSFSSTYSALFASRQIHKVYVAICVGHPGQTTIRAPICRSRKQRQLMTVADDADTEAVSGRISSNTARLRAMGLADKGKSAVSHVKTFAFDGKISAAAVHIETGRTHQIRVHLKHRRTPVLGDEAYGNVAWNKRYAHKEGILRPQLHAYELAFVHPFTDKQIRILAPLPDDMASLLAKLGPAADGQPHNTADDTCIVGPDGLLSKTAQQLLRGERPLGYTGFIAEDRLEFASAEEKPWTEWRLPETKEELESMRY